MRNKLYDEDLLDILLFNAFERLNYVNLYSEEIIKISKKYNKSIYQLFQRYKWLKYLEINPNEIHLKENHKLVSFIFDEYSKMLNGLRIEYYFTSGVLSYFLVNKKLERYHHDLDVFINMEDLELLEEKCGEYGFQFKRVLGDRGDGTNRIMLKMYYQDYDIPITVFMYEKEDNLSIVQKDYYYDCNGKLMIERIYNSPEIVNLSFSQELRYHEMLPYYSITPEALYLCKNGNRPKDVYDCEIFKNIIDLKKLKLLRKAMKDSLQYDIQEAEKDKFYGFITKNLQSLRRGH